MAAFTIKIDQLPEEQIEASDPRDAARKVAHKIKMHKSLRKLAADEPVQIKRPDGTPWGRNLTIGDFRAGLDLDGTPSDGDRPIRPARP